MEDNSASDNDSKECVESDLPKQNKKLKLNDGSSQDFNKETGPANNCDNEKHFNNGDSDSKAQVASTENKCVGTSEEPTNEVINAGPSSSNVQTILLNFRRPKNNRNYRKRRSSERDSDSDSSKDSDDISAEESEQNSRQVEESNSETESEDFQRLIATFSRGSPMDTDGCDGTSQSNESSDSVSDMTSNVDTDRRSSTSHDELWANRSVSEDNDLNEEDNEKLSSTLLKTPPEHNYVILREIINREMGLTFPYGKTTKNDVIFENNFYGSLHVVYRLGKLHHLRKHKGCVNSINFHPEGQLLASGSDDTNIVVWDWARKLALQTIKTGHKSNVFQSKFLYLNARSQLNIVTCARDGQVRLLQCAPSGGSSVSRRRLFSHSRAAHKLHITPSEPHIVISAGEDGLVMQSDVRAEEPKRLFQVKEDDHVIPLYSVAGHPLESRELIVAGRDKFVRMYDRRNPSKPLALYCPMAFENKEKNKRKRPWSNMHLTCAVYNHDGSEILGSYNDEDIYLFDTKKDVYKKDDLNNVHNDGFTHKYSGHRNSATFKGVSFFGPKSQYIVSGSDCSNIYVWEKKSEAIVQWMVGDESGVVNCIETHPRSPVLATSGLDRDVKIWIPNNSKDPTFKGLYKTVRENKKPIRRSYNDFLPAIYNAWHINRDISDDDEGYAGGNIEFEGNVCAII